MKVIEVPNEPSPAFSGGFLPPNTLSFSREIPGLLSDWLLAHDVVHVDRLGSGTSGTTLVRARLRSGGMLLIKILSHHEGAIEGHDPTSFLLKGRQVDHLKKFAPRVAARYVPLTAELFSRGWSAQVMPEMPGHDLLAPARFMEPVSSGVEVVLSSVKAILSELGTHGYLVQTSKPDSHYVVRRHLGRIRRRLGFIAPYVSRQALAGEGCTVNGYRVSSLQFLLQEVIHNPRMQRLLTPRLLSLPVHGDLNTRNIIIEPQCSSFWLVDPRGALSPIDFSYDAAKLLLSASLWDSVLRWGVKVRTDMKNGEPCVEVRLDRGAQKGYLELAMQLPTAIASVPALSPLGVPSESWLSQLLFTHAVHALAEAPCRISAGHLSKEAVHGKVITEARAFFYVGIVLLDQVISSLIDGKSPSLETLSFLRTLYQD